ncbi:MAG: PIN domain-containing protein [Solirubrobacteraceae bacterium MAG38_C4-C5]|nr:PIN domain-containing protein [Candidatus Siliceabacter maunaloa]
MADELEVVVDTDVASRLMRRSLPGDVLQALNGLRLRITYVTVGELFRGAAHARWGRRRVADMVDWLSDFEPIPGDRAVAERWGEITGHALATGRPRPANDAWIAACCLTHGLPLATLNPRDYEGITGLRLLSPA